MTLQESALGCTINKLGKTSTKSEKKLVLKLTF